MAGETAVLMPDMLWEDNVAASFTIDGSVKLVYVEAAGSMTIWQELAAWICSRGPDHWYTETGAAGPGLPVPAADEIFERRSRLAQPHRQNLGGWLAPGIRAWLVFSQSPRRGSSSARAISSHRQSWILSPAPSPPWGSNLVMACPWSMSMTSSALGPSCDTTR
jgi:hypothetical protein